MNLNNLLEEVQQNFEENPEQAMYLINEIGDRFTEIKQEYLKAEKVYKKAEHFYFALNELKK